MVTKAGQYNRKITFRIPVEVYNEVQESILQLQDFKTVWALIQPLRGRAYEEAKKVRTELTYKIKCRYSKALFQAYEQNNGMTIEFKNRTLTIIDMINVNESNIEIEIVAAEKVDNRVN